MTKSIYRFEVPIDDNNHDIKLQGGWPVHAAVSWNAPDPPVIEFWAEHLPDEEAETSTFRVFGTGHDIPDDYWHVLTAPRVAGLVFHLYEKVPLDELD